MQVNTPREKFTMSYLLDQEVSRDSINVNFSDMSQTILRDIESEMRDSNQIGSRTEVNSPRLPTLKHSRKPSKAETCVLPSKKTSAVSTPSNASAKTPINTNPTTVKKNKAAEVVKK